MHIQPGEIKIQPLHWMNAHLSAVDNRIPLTKPIRVRKEVFEVFMYFLFRQKTKTAYISCCHGSAGWAKTGAEWNGVNRSKCLQGQEIVLGPRLRGLSRSELN